jgi:RecA/RadA recombinase
MSRKDTVEDVAARLDRPRPRPETLKPEDALSTGSTLLNLELSGLTEGGFFPKRIYRFIGKSGSAKTFLTLTAFAEACKNPRYAKHMLIHDNPEDGALMDMAYYFGTEVARRVQPPRWYKDRPKQSRYVDEFFFNLNELTKKGVPFLCILDSIDALTTTEDAEHRKAVYSALRNHKSLDDLSGSYGTAKAKALSAGFNELEANLRDSDSMVIAISHAKMNIGRDAMFKPLTVSGGLGPQYYAHASIWTAVSGSVTTKITKGGREHTYKQGIEVALKIDKNRQTGNEARVIEIPVLKKYGIDDITSCINFLIEEGHWKKDNGMLMAEEFADKPIRAKDLVAMVEDAGLEPELQAIVGEVWRTIDEKTTPQRKRRYE